MPIQKSKTIIEQILWLENHLSQCPEFEELRNAFQQVLDRRNDPICLSLQRNHANEIHKIIGYIRRSIDLLPAQLRDTAINEGIGDFSGHYLPFSLNESYQDLRNNAGFIKGTGIATNGFWNLFKKFAEICNSHRTQQKRAEAIEKFIEENWNVGGIANRATLHKLVEEILIGKFRKEGNKQLLLTFSEYARKSIEAGCKRFVRKQQRGIKKYVAHDAVGLQPQPDMVIHIPKTFWDSNIFELDSDGNPIILADTQNLNKGACGWVAKIKLKNGRFGLLKVPTRWQDVLEADWRYRAINDVIPEGSVRLLAINYESDDTTAFYVTELIEDAIPISAHKNSIKSMVSKEYSPKIRLNAIFQALLLNQELIKKGIDHGDLHLGNVLFRPKDGHVFLIDYDRFTHIKEDNRISSKAISCYSLYSFVKKTCIELGLGNEVKLRFRDLLAHKQGVYIDSDCEHDLQKVASFKPLEFLSDPDVIQWFNDNLNLDISQFVGKDLASVRSMMLELLHQEKEAGQAQWTSEVELAPLPEDSLPLRLDEFFEHDYCKQEAHPVVDVAAAQVQQMVALQPLPQKFDKTLNDFWVLYGDIDKLIGGIKQYDQTNSQERQDIRSNNFFKYVSIASSILANPTYNLKKILKMMDQESNFVSHLGSRDVPRIPRWDVVNCFSEMPPSCVKHIVMKSCASAILELNKCSTLDEDVEAQKSLIKDVHKKLDDIISIMRLLLPADKELANRLIAEISFAKLVLSYPSKVKHFFKPVGSEHDIFHKITEDDPDSKSKRLAAICERLSVVRKENMLNYANGNQQYATLLQEAKTHIKQTIEDEKRFHRSSFEMHKKYIIEKYGKENCEENKAGDLFYIDKKGYRKALVESAWNMMGTHQKRVYAKHGEQFDEIAYRHYNSSLGFKIGLGVGFGLGVATIIAACPPIAGAISAAIGTTIVTQLMAAVGGTATVMSGFLGPFINYVWPKSGKTSEWKRTKYQGTNGESDRIQGQVVDQRLFNRNPEQLDDVQKSEFLQRGAQRTTQMKKSKIV